MTSPSDLLIRDLLGHFTSNWVGTQPASRSSHSNGADRCSQSCFRFVSSRISRSVLSHVAVTSPREIGTYLCLDRRSTTSLCALLNARINVYGLVLPQYWLVMLSKTSTVCVLSPPSTPTSPHFRRNAGNCIIANRAGQPGSLS